MDFNDSKDAEVKIEFEHFVRTSYSRRRSRSLRGWFHTVSIRRTCGSPTGPCSSCEAVPQRWGSMLCSYIFRNSNVIPLRVVIFILLPPLQSKEGFDDPWPPLDDYEAPYREPVLAPSNLLDAANIASKYVKRLLGNLVLFGQTWIWTSLNCTQYVLAFIDGLI